MSAPAALRTAAPRTVWEAALAHVRTQLAAGGELSHADAHRVTAVYQAGAGTTAGLLRWWLLLRAEAVPYTPAEAAALAAHGLWKQALFAAYVLCSPSPHESIDAFRQLTIASLEAPVARGRWEPALRLLLEASAAAQAAPLVAPPASARCEPPEATPAAAAALAVAAASGRQRPPAETVTASSPATAATGGSSSLMSIDGASVAMARPSLAAEVIAAVPEWHLALAAGVRVQRFVARSPWHRPLEKALLYRAMRGPSAAWRSALGYAQTSRNMTTDRASATLRTIIRHVPHRNYERHTACAALLEALGSSKRRVAVTPVLGRHMQRLGLGRYVPSEARILSTPRKPAAAATQAGAGGTSQVDEARASTTPASGASADAGRSTLTTLTFGKPQELDYKASDAAARGDWLTALACVEQLRVLHAIPGALSLCSPLERSILATAADVATWQQALRLYSS